MLMALAAIGATGCGSKQPTDADRGDRASSKVMKVDGVGVWLDPDGTKPYDDSAVVVVRNTGDKIADGVTIKLTWPNKYNTKQDEAIVVPPGKQGVFILGPFKAPPDTKGEPKAEVFVDSLKDGGQTSRSSSAASSRSGLSLSGTTSNTFKKAHPGVNGLVAGMRDGKVVTGGSIFFEEPGLTPGDAGTFKATLEPLCPEGKVDEWVAFPNLSVADLQDPWVRAPGALRCGPAALRCGASRLRSLECNSNHRDARKGTVPFLALRQLHPLQRRVLAHRPRELVEILRVQLLRAIAPRRVRVLRDLDDDPVGPTAAAARASGPTRRRSPAAW